MDDEILDCGYSREFLKQVSVDGGVNFIDLQLMASMVRNDGTTMLDDYINSLYNHTIIKEEQYEANEELINETTYFESEVDIESESFLSEHLYTEVIPFKYDYAYDFFEGLAIVKSSGYWGMIDKNGSQIVSFRYDDIVIFNEELARVKKMGNMDLLIRTERKLYRVFMILPKAISIKVL